MSFLPTLKRRNAGKFYLQRAGLNQIERLARQGFPYEICGFIGGPVIGSGQEIRPVPNIAPQPRLEYNIAPEETLAILLDFEGRGQKITGVFHSHPRYPARPSGTDLRLADLPAACYLITGVYDRPEGGDSLDCETRAWKIEADRAYPVELIIVD